MKNHTSAADIRIKRFMDKKMREFPELEDVSTKSRGVQQRGYSWNNMFNILQVKKG